MQSEKEDQFPVDEAFSMLAVIRNKSYTISGEFSCFEDQYSLQLEITSALKRQKKEANDYSLSCNICINQMDIDKICEYVNESYGYTDQHLCDRDYQKLVFEAIPNFLDIFVSKKTKTMTVKMLNFMSL
jgi:hypothetical protein